MSYSLLKTANNSFSTPHLTVVIEEEIKGKYQAMVLGWPDCKAEGNSREEVLINLRQVVDLRLKKAEIVALGIEVASNSDHPWMKFAGMYKDNPLFDEVIAYIATDRRQLDKEMETYYQELDAEREVR